MVGVLLAYLFPWAGVKEMITSGCLAACELIGLQVVRLSPATFVLGGMPLRIDTGCSMVDVYLGSLPLLWCAGRSWLWNGGVAASFFLLLMPLNIVRLVAGFWAISYGASWFWAHEVVAGFVYYAIFESLCQWRQVHDTYRK